MSATPTSTSSGPTSTPPSVAPANPQLLKIKLDTLPESLVSVLMLQNLGGLELTSITRYDMIDGTDTIYQPIKDIEQVNNTYSPGRLVDNSPPIFTGDSGYQYPFSWTEYDKDDTSKGVEKRPVEYSFLRDEITVNAAEWNVGVNDVVEIEIMTFDPGWYNYYGDNILNNAKYSTANYGSTTNAGKAPGAESFVHINESTLVSNPPPDTISTPTNTAGDMGINVTSTADHNYFDRPQHIVFIDPDEWVAWRAE